MSAAARPVHLVGNPPLANEEEVTRAAADVLGDRDARLPDGETGVRTNWIRWQLDRIARNPALEHQPDDPTAPPRFGLRPGVAPAGIATECGFGRRPPESVVPLLQLHRDAAALPPGAPG